MLQTIKRIIHWASKYKKRLYLGVFFSFLSSIMTSAPIMIAAWSLGKILDSWRNHVPLPEGMVYKVFLAISFFIFLRFILSYWKATFQESIGHEVAAEKRIEIGDILRRVSLGYFDQNSIGNILAGITTELSLLELQSMKMVDTILNGYIQLLAVLLCLLFFSPIATLIAILGVILSGLALSGISYHGKKNAPISYEATEDMSGAVIEFIRGLPIVKSFGQEGASIERFKKATENLKNIRISIEKGFVPYNCLHLLSLKLASVFLVLVCAWKTYQQQMPIEIFIMFIFFSFIIFESVENINNAAHILSMVDNTMDKLNNLAQENYIDKDGKNISITNYDIEFQNVTFGYGKKIILHDLNFKIPQNTMTAIIGPSGSGKSTICNLIARFYDVNEGYITMGGSNVKDFTCDSLMKNISMVFQNVYLFRDTIKNNIKFGKPDASEKEIVNAAKSAQCHEFIMSLPNGYDTMVGEGGASLSGGEKQRISIARAILKDAPIIILDEATASIDPENEYLIQEAISELTKGKTIITIAHRLETIENADEILVINNGTISQMGTHRELLKTEGLYKKFIKTRRSAETWSFK
ncbi:ABC transporter ATP-binding protein [Hathewaya limosa]|uniref:ATP-binding cassette subfamily B protein n=1 Tax=Hathewaya limosa TaxID=1536 RepID=A0ABU0JP53_HATLI|nr:ABC transporter ATP-binding protein [Hathewaya limosa]MDQ0478845.1 ATP-binding cassette subfamily B protein [Hathewaya limosa]